MKEREQISLIERANMSTYLEVDICHFGKLIGERKYAISCSTRVPGHHTPSIFCSLMDIRIWRKGMKLIGYRRYGNTVQMFYLLQKIAA